MNKRIVITGMSINTPIGDQLDVFIDNLLAGKSAITKWSSIDSDKIYSKIGGDLGNYDVLKKIKSYEQKIPAEIYDRLLKIGKKFPRAIGISILLAVEAVAHAKLIDSISGLENVATIVAGHNLNRRHVYENQEVFNSEPDFIDGLFALNGLDTHHVGTVTDVLQVHGPSYTVGGACASGNVALKCACDEIQLRDIPLALVVAPILDFSILDLQGMAMMGAISYKSFNDNPSAASRPYDLAREGFLPAHGAAAMIVEDLEHAKARGAKIYGEILGVSASADGCYLPTPSEHYQTRLIQGLLKQCKIHPEAIDFVCAHATSTSLGDLTEIRSIKNVFGAHAKKLKINAPKSMLGHTCWSSALVELVACLLQMERGELHPSINIQNIDPEVDLDVCQYGKVTHQTQLFLNNSFGFGGLNSISLVKRYEGDVS